jgi:hypothetical protein
MIKTLFGILQTGKKQIKPNYNWSDSIDSIADLPSEIELRSNGGLVSPETTKQEFKNRFHYLTVSRGLCLLALAFSVSKIFGEQPLFGFLSAVLASIIFGVIFIQYSYKSWVALYIWEKWNIRFSLKKPRFANFLLETITKPNKMFVFKL